jgi:hypothetical protein
MPILRHEGEAQDDQENDDTETVTDATTSNSDTTAPPKLTKAETRALKKAAKVAKSQNKAFKNQAKHTISVRTEDVETVNKVLHGDTDQVATHPLASDKTIEEVMQRNMGYMSNIADHKRQMMSSIAQKRRSERERRRSVQHNKKRRFSSVGDADDTVEEDEETEQLLAAALTNLGIAPAHAGGAASGGQSNVKKCVGKSPAAGTSSAQASIVANLRTLVKDDLERHENEQRETCIRAGGFWRYVGRPVFERMTKIAEELDWKTGALLKNKAFEE